ncbi:type II toxin-antitoxin system VapC family toxin [Rhizobium sp. 2MFCol3.1]|uniref:type II toxin-antitoxin system VapC family toxin n=1 Tax=Rhizobium sp. 2MFCol3.1 TaxID=1246459 RepID=UPI0003762B42|nr:type II toxin-antitoxin system VapC family toxin [Rhizobium sp. 2MFCol3.1]
MAGAVLDTHALLWLVTQPETLHDDALVAIAGAQEAGRLFVSPITAWELAIAVNKKTNAPDIGNFSVKDWFKAALDATSSKLVPIGPTIALEAANIIAKTGHKDPGDCYIMATARYKKVPIVTRDATLGQIAEAGYIQVVGC